MDERCPVCNNPIDATGGTCPACGFRHVETTQSFQPVTLSETDIISAVEKPATKAVLRVVRGPQIEMAFHLEGGSYSIGRSPDCKIFLNDMTVSRNHADITQTDEGFSIKDRNSFNGVWINNVNTNEAILCEGDIIQIGAFCLLFQATNGK